MTATKNTKKQPALFENCPSCHVANSVTARTVCWNCGEALPQAIEAPEAVEAPEPQQAPAITPEQVATIAAKAAAAVVDNFGSVEAAGAAASAVFEQFAQFWTWAEAVAPETVSAYQAAHKAPEAPKPEPTPEPTEAPEAPKAAEPTEAPEAPKAAEPPAIIDPKSAEGQSAEATNKWASFVYGGGLYAELRRVYAIAGRSFVKLNKLFISVRSSDLQRVYITSDKERASRNYSGKKAEAAEAREAQKAEQEARKAQAEAERIAQRKAAEAAQEAAQKAAQAEADKAVKAAEARKAQKAPVEAEAPKAPQPVEGKPWRAKGAKQVTTYEIKTKQGTLFVPVWEAPCKEHPECGAELRTSHTRGIEATAIRAYLRKGYKVACILHRGTWSCLYLSSPAQGEEAHKAGADPQNWKYSPRAAMVYRAF